MEREEQEIEAEGSLRVWRRGASAGGVWARKGEQRAEFAGTVVDVGDGEDCDCKAAGEGDVMHTRGVVVGLPSGDAR